MRTQKPRPIDGMVRGYELRDTLEIIERWDTMSDDEKATFWSEDTAPDEPACQLH